MRALGAVAVAATALLTLTFLLTPTVPGPPAAYEPSAAPVAIVTATAPAARGSALPTRTAIPVDQLRISLPRLGIELPMALGDIDRDVRLGATPENVALLFPTTNPPGTGGNSYIYAHARNEMFLQLWNVTLGDRVRITAGDGTHFDYAVTRIVPRVDPADTSWLDPTGPERVTLQTSTGPTSAYPRFIAVAERVAQLGE
jgi:LPXTG-site transpeptidase (sortase) family protein